LALKLFRGNLPNTLTSDQILKVAKIKENALALKMVSEQ